MDSDQRVSVCALAQERHLGQLKDRAPVALHDHSGARRQHSGEGGRQLRTEDGRESVWRVNKNEIVLTKRKRR
jgi:hypothetical protein